MRLNPPKKVTFWVSMVAFVIGAALSVGAIPGLTVVGYIVTLLAYVLLVLGLLIKGL